MIDELIRHCVQEIGLDGDAGTDVDRLQQHISDFHRDKALQNPSIPQQTIDDAFRAFVFRALISHPDVHVGTHVAGTVLRDSVKGTITRRVERGGVGSRKQDVATPAAEQDRVELIPDERARRSSLTELQQEHGDDLRLVLSSSVIRTMLAGTAEKGMSEACYRCLQLICRAREAGIASTELGTRLRFDQKTIFYVTKKLTEPGIVYKLKAPELGTSASFFVAARFRDRCPLWTRQQEADQRAATGASTSRRPAKRVKMESEADDSHAGARTRRGSAGADVEREGEQNIAADNDNDGEEDNDDDDAEASAEYSGAPVLSLNNFDADTAAEMSEPLDAGTTMLWLVKLPHLVRMRLYAYLKQTSAGVALRNRLQGKIGLCSDTVRLRRAFRAFLESMLREGQIEVVGLLTPGSMAVDDKRVQRGLRLTDQGEVDMQHILSREHPDPARDERAKLAEARKAALERNLRMRDIRVTRELTLERQLHDLVAQAGSSGATLQQLYSAFNVSGQIKRTFEMLVERSEETTAEASTADMRIRQFHEFLGRERRLRLYSQHAWCLQAANEGHLDGKDADALASAGDFPELDADSFFTDANDAALQTLARVPEAFVERGYAENASERHDPITTPASTSKKRLGRPKGRLNKKTIDKMRQEEARARSRSKDADATRSEAATESGVDAEATNPAAPEDQTTTSTGGTDGLGADVAGTSNLGNVAIDPAIDTADLVVAKERDSSASARPGHEPQSQSTNDGQDGLGEDISAEHSAARTPFETPVKMVRGPVQAPAPSTPANGRLSTPGSGSVRRDTQTGSEYKRKAKSNLTALRSDLALLECIEEYGGAMDTLSVPQELDSYIEKHKDRYSSQVLNLSEKRVRDRAIGRAIDQGTLKRTYVKQLKPSERSQRTIIYLPSIAPAKLKAFCDDVVKGKQGWSRSLDAASLLGTPAGNVRLDARDVHSLSVRPPWRDTSRLDLEVFKSDPALAEKLRSQMTTLDKPVKQLLGHCTSSVVRLIVFHLACIKVISEGKSSRARQFPTPKIDLSYFWTEAPLEVFVAICAPRFYSSDLEAACQDPTLRYTPVSYLNADIREALGLARSGNGAPIQQTQTALYSMAVQLASMGIVEAISDSELSQPAVHLSMPETTFELADRVPLYNWRIPESRPAIKMLEVGMSMDRARRFWEETAAVCSRSNRHMRKSDNNKSTLPIAAPTSVEGLPPNNDSRTVNEDLLKPKAWRMGHQLRANQRKFLSRFLQPDGERPSDEVARLAARISLVPISIVKRFWSTRLAPSSDTPRAKSKKPLLWDVDLAGIPVADIKAAAKPRQEVPKERGGRRTTLRKAKELRAARVADFENMLSAAIERAPAAEAMRGRIEYALRQIKKRFVESHPNFGKEEVRRNIEKVVGTATGERVKLPPIKRRKSPDRFNEADWVDEPDSLARPDHGDGDSRAHDEALPSVAVQGPTRRKGRKRAAEDRATRSSRRGASLAHYWTPQKNELLRDATVILKARDRVRGRSDWTALAQILDEAEQLKQQNFVFRQWKLQLTRMRNEFGEEGYLSALEREWTRISDEARAAGELADPNFPSATDFDLRQHIDFLRSKIDKNAIFASLERSSQSNPLPQQLARHDFTQHWLEEFRHIPAQTKWEDFHTHESGNVHRRFGMMLGNALVLETPSYASPSRDDDQQGARGIGAVEAALMDELAECAVRAIVLSDNQRCSDTDKDLLCERIGENRIEAAVVRMLETRELRPTTAEIMQRRRPGSNFALTDDLFHRGDEHRADAVGLRPTLARLDDKLEQSKQEPMFVEPVETDGEAACLVTLLSDNLMTAGLDVAPFTLLREHHAFNARILNDDQIEAILSVSATMAGVERSRHAATRLPSPVASGVVTTHGLIDEAAAWARVSESRPAGEIAAIQDARKRLESAGPEGVDLGELLTLLQPETLDSVVHDATAPVFYAGREAVRVVLSSHAHLYALPPIEAAGARHLPRLWRDIHGRHQPHLWRRLIDLLAATCVQRPGISLGTLYAKFTSAASAVEVFEAVEALTTTGRFSLRWDYVDELEKMVGSVHPTSGQIWAGFEDEEQQQEDGSL